MTNSSAAPLEVRGPSKLDALKESMAAKIIGFALSLICGMIFLTSLAGILIGEDHYDVYTSDSFEEVLSSKYSQLTEYNLYQECIEGLIASDYSALEKILDNSDYTSFALYDEATKQVFFSYKSDVSKDDVAGSGVVEFDYDLPSSMSFSEFNEEHSGWPQRNDSEEIEIYKGEIHTTVSIDFTVSEVPASTDYLVEAFDTAHFLYSWKEAFVAIAIVSFLIALASFAFLIMATGHRKGKEGLVLARTAKLPFDALTLAAAIAIPICAIPLDILSWSSHVTALVALVALAVAVDGTILIAWAMGLAIRIKTHTLLKGMLLWKLGKAIGRGFARLPLIPKTASVVAGFCVIEGIAIVALRHNWELFAVLWLIAHVALAILIASIALSMRELQSAGKSLANGDFNAHVDTSKMRGDFKAHGENLNSALDGLQIAIDEQMKSERMRADLITNVSHDIKTPVTSIINYTDLLLKEDLESEKAIEYARVISRQADRLKNLVSDIVDASKASSGVLNVELEACEAGIILSQVAGEFEQKLEEKNLELVITEAVQNVIITADRRHLWRIFQNLMSNICKYSEAGTRVYISLEKSDAAVTITFRNISHEKLNITPAELMERFVRGDASRNTEGSGLGLEIASSLAKLQGASLDLQIDGDLFKAILTFPIK